MHASSTQAFCNQVNVFVLIGTKDIELSIFSCKPYKFLRDKLLRSHERYLGLVSLRPHNPLLPDREHMWQNPNPAQDVNLGMHFCPSPAFWLLICCWDPKRQDLFIGKEKRAEIWVSFSWTKTCEIIFFVTHQGAASERPESEEVLRDRTDGLSLYRRDSASFWNRIGGRSGCGAEALFCCGNPGRVLH